MQTGRNKEFLCPIQIHVTSKMPHIDRKIANGTACADKDVDFKCMANLYGLGIIFVEPTCISASITLRLFKLSSVYALNHSRTLTKLGHFDLQ